MNVSPHSAPTSTAPATYNQRRAAWDRAVTRAQLALSRARLTRERRRRAQTTSAAPVTATATTNNGDRWVCQVITLKRGS